MVPPTTVPPSAKPKTFQPPSMPKTTRKMQEWKNKMKLKEAKLMQVEKDLAHCKSYILLLENKVHELETSNRLLKRRVGFT